MLKRDIQELLVDVECREVAGGIDVSGIAYDSRVVESGDAFVCVAGFAHDGHEFAREAVSRGAVALVVERELTDLAETPQFIVDDTRIALAHMADRFFGRPSRDLAVAGVTGTNGKTTTTYLLDSILRASGAVTGIIGTVETRIGGETQAAGRTTPESADVQRLLTAMQDAGVGDVVMEVSSHAIDLHRVDGVHFQVAAFTNLTQDHLDYHHTIEEYFSVKRRLFTDLDVTYRVVNIDDGFGAGMAAELDDVITVGFADGADVTARDVDLAADGARFELVMPSGSVPVRLPLAGAFNVSNALVAAGCAHALEVDADAIRRGLEEAPQVPGRLERIDAEAGFAVYVDYAHTPDSLAKAVKAVREVTPGRVIVVFGAGGDRDPEKRPLMGRAAAAEADHAVVTSDNPRSEDPVSIILQIEDGLREGPASYEVEVDRRRAITHAIGQATAGDAVLVAGKGHEDYQIFAEQTIHFDDREVVREELGV